MRENFFDFYLQKCNLHARKFLRFLSPFQNHPFLFDCNRQQKLSLAVAPFVHILYPIPLVSCLTLFFSAFNIACVMFMTSQSESGLLTSANSSANLLGLFTTQCAAVSTHREPMSVPPHPGKTRTCDFHLHLSAWSPLTTLGSN